MFISRFIVGVEGLFILKFSWILLFVLLFNWCGIWRVCSNVVIIRAYGIIIVVVNHSCKLRKKSCKGGIGISNRESITVLEGDKGGLALSLANLVTRSITSIGMGSAVHLLLVMSFPVVRL